MKNEPSNPETPVPADLELEARLTRALARLPDAPVPSNFTARLMQAVDLEESRRLAPLEFRLELARAAAAHRGHGGGGVFSPG